MPSASAASGFSRRIRILFIDDQPEVAKTLSGLLGASFEFQFADNGEDGLARLVNEVFDLAVVDLQMPPGRWGGLWLLSELSARELQVDTLVLSGQAGQSETIDAMRLGARDFVVKDRVSVELVDRVDGVLAIGAKDRAVYAASQLPAPVALPYQRMGIPKDPDAYLRASLTTAEAVLRLCALAATALARANGALNQALFTKLVRPSLGAWLDVCRMLSPQVGDHAVSRWIKAASGKEADAIVRHRNEVFHGGGVPAGGVQAALVDVLGWLDFFVLAARSGAPIELVAAGEMAFSGTAYSVEWARLAGSARSVAWIREEVSSPPVTGRVYMRSSFGKHVDMWPFVLADRNESTGDWAVAIMDGIHQRRPNAIESNDRIRYVDTASGTRRKSSTTVFGDLISTA